MKTTRYCVALILLLTAPAARCAAAVTYTATILHPLAGFTNTVGYGASGGDQTGHGDGSATGSETHALLWSGTAASVVDLHPNGYVESIAWAVAGTGQVGNADIAAGRSHAALWSGTAASFIDLHPPGLTNPTSSSRAYGASSTNQVGYSIANGVAGGPHATLWSGTAASAVDLHPVNFLDSTARGVSGGKQVGYGTSIFGNNNHAILWSGTAVSAVDLNPANYINSFAYGISGGKQVGYGSPSSGQGNEHAVLWSGTAASAVDLNPAGFTESVAHGISSVGQVGYGFGTGTGNRNHALVWTGTAASAIDLHQFLSGLGMTFILSHAEAIAENGSIMGVANDSNNRHYAILWTPVPEPISGGLVACGVAAVLLIRPRRVLLGTS